MELEKKERRFQECNWLEKLWRYRWYVPIPFKWSYLVVRNFLSPKRNGVSSRQLYGLMIGDAQCAMKWYYTQAEVEQRIAGHREKYQKLRSDISALEEIEESNSFIETTGEILQIVEYPEYKTTDYESISLTENSTGYVFSEIVDKTLQEIYDEIGEHNVMTMDVPMSHSIAVYKHLSSKRRHIYATIGLDFEGEFIALENTHLHLDYQGMDTNMNHYFGNMFIELGDGTMIDLGHRGEIFNATDTNLINKHLGKLYTYIIYIH